MFHFDHAESRVSMDMEVTGKKEKYIIIRGGLARSRRLRLRKIPTFNAGRGGQENMGFFHIPSVFNF